MPTTEELALNPYPSLLIIGDAGTKKTTICGDFPKPYFFDFDKGMAVLRGRKGIVYDSFRDAPYGSKTVIPSAGVYEYGTAWPKFLAKLNEIGELIDKGECPYETLVIDSLTTFGNAALAHVMAGARKSGRYKAGDSIDQGLWGAQMGLMEMVVDQLTSWPVIKIMTAHIQRDKNTFATEGIEMLPYTTGKFAGKIPIYFDEVWYTTVDAQGVVKLQCAPSGIMKSARSRFNVPTNTKLEWAAVQKYLLAGRANAATAK